MNALSTPDRPAATAGFVGWLKLPGRPWQAVCSAPAFDDALAELLVEAARVGGGHRDLIVTPAGRHPTGAQVKQSSPTAV
jgi:hypothetical protein